MVELNAILLAEFGYALLQLVRNEVVRLFLEQFVVYSLVVRVKGGVRDDLGCLVTLQHVLNVVLYWLHE